MDEPHRFDVLRLMRQVPAVLEVTLVDGQSIERMHVSRVDPDVVNSGTDRSNDPAVQSLMAGWRARGHTIGFGVGLAKGSATVGTRPLRGFAEAVPVFAVQPHDRDLMVLPAAK
jgi:hypothetical protein